MAQLNYSEQRIIDKFVTPDSSPGYVLDFSDKTFCEFVFDVTGLNIDLETYRIDGNSKGKRFKAFCKLELDNIVGKLLRGLHDYKLAMLNSADKDVNTGEFEQFYKISERLLSGAIVEHIDAIKAINDDKDFHQLAKLIKESIEKDEPAAALDRLHTYLIKFLRELCHSHRVTFEKEEAVNAVYGKYIRVIREKGFVDSEMSKNIIQSTFQVIQSFNDVRNNKTFAHDNPVLNYDESILIFNYITATVKFIQAIESKNKNEAIAEATPDWNTF